MIGFIVCLILFFAIGFVLGMVAVVCLMDTSKTYQIDFPKLSDDGEKKNGNKRKFKFRIHFYE